jgi:pSer/pThr/pTyr-binding forkhead associated (FHA) protein
MPCPVGSPERIFPLDFAENLIGRRSERRGIYPEIDLSSDPGVSSRHAILYREANGTLTLLDVGSTNGTQLGGKEIAAGVRTSLQEGNQITVGCWTRLTVRRATPNGGGQPS